MKLKYLIFILCYPVLLSKIEAIGSMGPLGNIVVNAIYECSGDDKPTGDDFKIKIALNNINDKGDKAVDIVCDSKISFDDNLNYFFDIKKYENGGWKNLYNVKGKPCQDFDRYAKKLWKKITAHVEPKLDKPCPISPGSYKLNKFQAEIKDLDIKTVFYGRMLLKTIHTDKNKKNVLCIMADITSQAPI